MTAQLLDEDLPKSRLGEGAFWDGRTSTFYWVDIEEKAVHAFHIETRNHQLWSVSKKVSFVLTSETGGLVLGLFDGIYDFDPTTGRETPVALIELPHDYHADTGRSTIWVYDYDLERGVPTNKRVFVKKDGWSPDGLCMDPEDRLLVAVFGGSALEMYSHRGDLIHCIELPVPNVTSSDIADGEIIITTAYDWMNDADRRRAPMSGAVFRAPLPA